MTTHHTTKGQATRQRLLDTAIELFESRGYEATTMRGIAKAAGVSTGLAYRYFEGKEALVAELYARLAREFADSTVLPPGSWTTRSLAALDASFAVLRPHREVLAQLMASSLTHRGISPPLARTAPIAEAVFAEAVSASDSPPSHPHAMAELAYLAHLALLLFWVLDRSEDQRATTALRRWLGGVMPTLTMALYIPGAMRAVMPLLDIVRLGVLGREEAA